MNATVDKKKKPWLKTEIPWDKQKEPMSTMETPTTSALPMSTKDNPTPAATAPKPQSIDFTRNKRTGELESVNYKGKTLTPIEYEQLRSAQATGATDIGVGAARNQFSPALRRAMQEANLENAIRFGKITREQIENLTKTPELQTPSITPEQIQEQGRTMRVDYETNLNQPKTVAEKLSTGRGLYAFMPNGEEKFRNLTQNVARLLNATVSKLPFGIGKMIKEDMQLAEIDEGYKAVTSQITDTIPLIEAGLVDAEVARSAVIRGINFANAMHAETKGLGRLNVDYWVDNGLAREEKAQAYLVELTNLLRKIDDAEVIGRQARQQDLLMANRMQEQYGLGD